MRHLPRCSGKRMSSIRPTPPRERGRQADGRIHGKVAELLNARSIAINVGRNQGVEEGMRFQVLSRAGGDILDPDTREKLGTLLLPKVRVEVRHVFDEFAIAQTVGTRYRSPGLAAFPTWLFAQGGETPITLRRSDNPDVEEIDASDSIVQIGDQVVEVPGGAPASQESGAGPGAAP